MLTLKLGVIMYTSAKFFGAQWVQCSCFLLRMDSKSIELDYMHCKVRKKAKIRNPYNQIRHLTQISQGKVTKHKKTTYIRQTWGQPFPSRWPKGCKEQTRQCDRHTQIQITKTKAIALKWPLFLTLVLFYIQ